MIHLYSDKALERLGEILSNATLDKNSLGWDLETLEASTRRQVIELDGPDSDDESEPCVSRGDSDDEDDGSSVEFSSIPSSSLSATSTLSSSSLPSNASAPSSAHDREHPE